MVFFRKRALVPVRASYHRILEAEGPVGKTDLVVLRCLPKGVSNGYGIAPETLLFLCSHHSRENARRRRGWEKTTTSQEVTLIN